MANQEAKRIRVIAAAIVAALAAAALFFQPSAATADQDAYLDRTAYCLDLLLNDPIAHARECGGGPATMSLKSLSEPVQGAPAKAVDPCDETAINGGSPNSPCPQANLIAPYITDWLSQLAPSQQDTAFGSLPSRG